MKSYPQFWRCFFVSRFFKENMRLYSRAGEPTARVPKISPEKTSLVSDLHCWPNISISFAPRPSLYCAQYVYIHTYLTAQRLYMNYRCYQITLQWNIFTQIGGVRSVDWIFIVGVPDWRWLGEYVTLDRTFYSLLLVTGRISDIGQNVLQSSTWHWTALFTVFFW